MNLRRRVAFLVVLMALAVMASSCLPAVAEGPVLPTPCPSVTAIPAPVPVPPASKLIYALVDRSISYEALSRQALGLFADVLDVPGVVSPGDRVMVSWIGSDSYSPSSSLFSEVVPRPPERGFPTPVPSPTEPPSGSPVLSWAAYAKQVQKFQCDVATQNRQVKSLVDAGETDRKAALQAFHLKAGSLKNIETPKGDPSTGICDALSKVSEVFSSPLDGVDWASYRLLIFSDMEEWPLPKGGRLCDSVNLKSKLKGVTVVVAMFYCPNGQVCQNWRANYPQMRDAWETVFQDAEASLVSGFLRVEASTPETVAYMLR